MIDFYHLSENGKRKRFRRTVGKGTTLKEAEKLERKWKRELEREGSRILELADKNDSVIKYEKSAKFSGFARHWMDTYAKAHNKPSEQKSKEKILRVHLVPFFMDQDLREIDREQIEEYIASRKRKKLAPKTINNHLAVLRKLLTTANEWGYMETHPMAGVKALKDTVKEFDFYTLEEVELFLDAAKKYRPDWHSFFCVGFYTGMRLGELCELRWKDVDFERVNIRVQRNVYDEIVGTPKGGKARNIPMIPSI
jgi:integrase